MASSDTGLLVFSGDVTEDRSSRMNSEVYRDMTVIYDCNVCMFTGSCTTNHLTLFPSQLLECLSFAHVHFEVICTVVQFVFFVSCFLVYV